MTTSYRFPSWERLKSSKEISELFNSGKNLSRPPLFVKYKIEAVDDSEKVGLAVAFTVSKRNFKRAVDRNRIKRLMREAFRLQIPMLREEIHRQHWQLRLVIVYTGNEMPLYKHIDRQTGVVLKKLLKIGAQKL